MSEQRHHEPSVTEWRTQELLVRLEERMSNIQREVSDIRTEMRSTLVTKEAFKPVRMAVYAGVSLVATGFFGVILAVLTSAR